MKLLGPILLFVGLTAVHGFFEFVIDSELEELFGSDSGVGGYSNLNGPPQNINRYERQKRDIPDFEEEEEEEEEEQVQTGDQIIVHNYKVQSFVTSRFAHTVIRTKVSNRAQRSQSVAFEVTIPKTSFITNFTMDVNGITFTGTIKEKNTARNIYNQAKARGKAAGIIRTNSREMESFRAEVNVPAGSKIMYELHYEETLIRKLSVYEHIINLQPGYLVNNLQVDIYISEPQGIQYIEVSNLLGEKFKDFFHTTHTDDKAHVTFKPTLESQRKCENCTTTGIDGQIVVKYDTMRERNGGSLQVFNGFFVHFFAPTNLSPLPKNIIFVIDVSGSMWGLKMKQTVQAMHTILDDLRPEDHFTIIDFNHNIRCWSEDLIAATPLQVRDAKSYIQAIQPVGGTNINGALLRSITILRQSSDLGFLDPHSVSLIFLISDGDPTVGELKLSNIQKNVEKKMRPEYSLFTVGIGFDVDYNFLERLAQDNRGMAQRIYGTQDASSQLRNFYSQVATPLLQGVEFHYSPDTYTDVTQNCFNRFFSGSEIVVAGKLSSNVTSIPVIVTANSSQMQLSFDVNADDLVLDDTWTQQKYVFKDFAKQFWAFLTIKQLLVERNTAKTAQEKREITKKIMDIAVQHQFVTPLTAILIESKDSDEKMLGDSPKSTKSECCPGTTIPGQKTSPKNFPDQPTSTQSVIGGPTYTTIVPGESPIDRSSFGKETETVTSVENDPHFIIHLPKSQEDVCFNVDPEPGKILNLVTDSQIGIAINGKIIGAKKPVSSKLQTYFGTFGFYFLEKDLQIEINTERIITKDGKNHAVMYWSETGSMIQKGVTISVQKNTKVKIALNEDMYFVIYLHRVWKQHPVNVDFLGIYAPTTNKFSSTVHGLIGQFFNEPEINVYNIRAGEDPEKPIATMEVKGNKLTVTRGWQKDYWTNTISETNVYCWFVHNSGKGFIDGHYKDYFVSHLYSHLPQP
ncbi:inter-alpha-trypsin inhibitor heavy chain H2 isoform X2 [Protopterus annectens]|uniref:inter-alpha-trypsin inhibitor heavy chain H2 isoform X2 n=1 Tax=Protopterus annectens TaxID=7888 RepID=UPI001CFC34BF|nr:inter-alpha-trypsin inhibitor heavy chain H2 isoform X2 [Protopterus annectens]